MAWFQQKSGLNLKNSEIPVLEGYDKDPGFEFWKKFPFKQIPSKAETKIEVEALDKELKSVKDSLTKAEWDRGCRAIQFLRVGAPSFQKSPLPSCWVKNAESTVKFGPEVTDNIATWVKRVLLQALLINHL